MEIESTRGWALGSALACPNGFGFHLLSRTALKFILPRAATTDEDDALRSPSRRDRRTQAQAMQPLLTTSIRPVWSNIRAARASVREVLAQHPGALVDAAAMTACELLENAIKYGEEVPAAGAILFTLSLIEERIDIVVVNGCTDQSSVDRLLDRIQSLRDAPNKADLYIGQLQELLAGPSESTNLGIYRIAVEGGFTLDATYADDVVTVTATRSVYG
ncbi:hypothetical protein WME79_13260 [Sorangium sp. So ce726]|uniref:hypothetical protein n=1 Tax=Sorangium sp. So ce726 TaxID=3133319 RepID=UPI003F5FB713